MKLVRPLRPIFGLCIAVAVSSGCTVRFTSNLHLFSSTKTTTAEHVPISPIDVETHNGSIRVASSERADVEIVATIQAESQQRADETEVVAERDEAGKLVIRVAWPGGERRSRESCSLDISLPGASGVTLRSHNGEFSLVGLAGTANLLTHNGEISVQEHDGNLLAVTHNGEVTAEDLTGSISIETHNGEIDITGATAEVEAHTRNGTVDISLANEGTGPITAETHNGAVTLDIGEAFSGRLEATTSNGEVDVAGIPEDRIIERQRNRAIIQFEEGAAASSIQTHNGAVTIRHRGRDVKSTR